jgi:hypothetical protein
MQVGDVVSGYGDENGIHLHIIGSMDGDTIELQIKFYDPAHPDFAWAIEMLNSVSE